MAPGDELLALQFAVVVGCLTGEQYAACSLYVYARSAWERSDTTAQYCAGFFPSAVKVRCSPYLISQRQVRYGSSPPPCKAITGLQRVCSQVKAEAPVSGQDGACDVLSVISGVLTGVTSGNSRLEAYWGCKREAAKILRYSSGYLVMPAG